MATLRHDCDDLLAKLPINGDLLFVVDLRKLKDIDVVLQEPGGRADRSPTAYAGFNSWTHDAVMHDWKRSLFGIAPSLWSEPYATVMMEGTACDKPMIGAWVGGTTNMIADGETGFLVPPKDGAALWRSWCANRRYAGG